MYRKIWTLLAGASLAFSSGATSAQDAVFSISTDQLVTAMGGGIYLQQQGLYDAGPGLTQVVAPFLPAPLGLDAVDLAEDGRILFSVKASGVAAHSGGLIQLDQACIYSFDPATGQIALVLDWAARGVDIGTLDAFDRLPDGSYAFSVESMHWITPTNGSMTIDPQSLYRFDPSLGTVTILLDGKDLGLADLDAASVLEDGRIAFSTAKNVWVQTAAGGVYLKHCNAYLHDGGLVSLLLDGETRGLKSLDALALCTFSLRVERDRIVWGIPGVGAEFDLIRGSLNELRAAGGDFAATTIDCLASGIVASPVMDPHLPGPGQGSWYLARRNPPSGIGTWNSGGAGQIVSRDPGVAASGVGCP